MDDSILNSIKKMLGLDADYIPFDAELIMHINGVFMVLRQLGIGPNSGFSITDNSATWSDFSNDMALLEAVKPYVALKVKTVWDPPSSGTVLDAIQKQIAEYEWRLNVEVDPGREIS